MAIAIVDDNWHAMSITIFTYFLDALCRKAIS